MVEKNDSHGRQDFRIDDVISVADNKITEEEYNLSKGRVSAKSRQNSMLQQMVGKELFSAQEHGVLGAEVAGVLDSLDAKLNYLIGVNMLKDNSQSAMKERPVNLSVTGVSFVTKNSYKLGEYAQVDIMLPTFPPVSMELVCTIKRAIRLSNGLMKVAFCFYFRSDEEATTISQYVFRRHRELIRAKNLNA
ncbi:MAG: PilZ domain-containing protein [Mariprofundus sp.]|nr:PilZ domain-containing protein [Mariprofundus sp.]